MLRFLEVVICAFSIALAATASAESVRVITSDRVTLGDLMDGLSDERAGFDLGPAPPPGGSRLFTKREIEPLLEGAGIDPKKLALPHVVRVKSASERWEVSRIRELVTPALEAALPEGIQLARLDVRRPIVVSPSARVGGVTIPKAPRREGPWSTTAVVEIVHGDNVVLRLPLPVALDISAEAAKPTLTRGARVELVIERGAARVSASAVAMSDGEVGQVILFQVQNTQKALKGRIESATLARVVGP